MKFIAFRNSCYAKLARLFGNNNTRLDLTIFVLIIGTVTKRLQEQLSFIIVSTFNGHRINRSPLGQRVENILNIDGALCQPISLGICVRKREITFALRVLGADTRQVLCANEQVNKQTVPFRIIFQYGHIVFCYEIIPLKQIHPYRFIIMKPVDRFMFK